MPGTKEKYIVRILDENEPIGAGFLVSTRHIITCAHVISGLGDVVTLDFPVLSTDQKKASVKKLYPVNENPTIGDIEDIAVLELLPDQELPNGAIPAIVKIEEMYDHGMCACGFPEDNPVGSWIDGVIKGSRQDGRTQFDKIIDKKFVKKYFSGTAVWDKDVNAVVGMVVAKDIDSDGISTGYMYPASTLAKAWSGLNLKKSAISDKDQKCENNDKTSKIGDYHMYTCDRIRQHDQFMNRDKKKEDKVRFFCLHGWEVQSPKGLVKRFDLELKKNTSGLLRKQNTNEASESIHEIKVEDSYDKELFRKMLIRDFFKHFNLDSDKFDPAIKSNLGVVCNNSPLLLKGNSAIETVYLRIDPEEWREFIPEVLDWFVNTFCSEELVPVSAPKFYFFISFIYGEEEGEEACIDIREKMLPALENVKGVLIFDKFDKVEKMHITKWLGKCLTDSTGKERKEIFAKHFDDQDEYEMDDVEKRLGNIIEDLKNN
jgi:hypothetical protein